MKINKESGKVAAKGVYPNAPATWANVSLQELTLVSNPAPLRT